MTRSQLQDGPATDHYHNALGPSLDSGGSGTSAVISITDPGAIGAGNLWIRLDPTETYSPMLYVRDASNTDWVDQAHAGMPMGLSWYIGDEVTGYVNGDGYTVTAEVVNHGKLHLAAAGITLSHNSGAITIAATGDSLSDNIVSIQAHGNTLALGDVLGLNGDQLDTIPARDAAIVAARTTISATDPGAIGAKQLWLRPDADWGLSTLFARNEADDGWIGYEGTYDPSMAVYGPDGTNPSPTAAIYVGAAVDAGGGIVAGFVQNEAGDGLASFLLNRLNARLMFGATGIQADAIGIALTGDVLRFNGELVGTQAANVPAVATGGLVLLSDVITALDTLQASYNDLLAKMKSSGEMTPD